MTFVACVADEDYEIETEFPHRVRKVSNGRILKETLRDDGYVVVALKGKVYYKHRLIAQQFISNPNNLTEVDHINQIRYDNRIENLRYVSSSTNNRNRSGIRGLRYDFLEYTDLDEDPTVLDKYGNHKFEDYYYDAENDLFLYDTGSRYRVLYECYLRNGTAYVNCIDVEGKTVHVLYNKFKRLYGFI